MNEITSARTALEALTLAIAPISAADASRPTPCRDYTVAALGDHLVTTIVNMGQDVGFASATPAATSLQDRVAAVGPPLLDFWADRGESGDVVLSGRPLPAHLALAILSLEMTVHAWDFAAAQRQPVAVSDDHAEHVLAMAHQTITPESRRIAGFDQPIPVRDDASALDRLVAFTGRDPSWA